MTDLFPTFTAAVDRGGLIRAGDTVLAGVSGGADSVVMLHLLMRLAADRGFSVSVAHYNHSLREGEADRDEQFTADLAARLGIPFHAEKGDVRGYAGKNRISVETAARELRMDFFHRLARSGGYTRISLGHHADDQAETVIMNLMRGSGSAGLGGIKQRRGSIIHPLLTIPRERILAYAADRGLSYVTDATNAEYDYLRNRIRHRLLPAMREIFGRDPIQPLCRTADIQQEIDECLLHLSQDMESTVITVDSPKEIILDIDNLISYLRAVQKRFLIRILTRLSDSDHPVGYREIERLVAMISGGRSGSRLDLGCGVTCIKSAGQLVCRAGEVTVKTRNIRTGRWYDIPECGCRIRLGKLPLPPQSPYPRDGSLEYLDSGLLADKLVLRGARPGDRFVPLGMTGKKKLQDFFTDAKIPAFQRVRIPVLFCGDQIVWVVGLRIDDRYKVTDKTKETLKAEIVPLGE